MTARPTIPNKQARELFLDAHGLLARPVGPARATDIGDAIHALGFVQVDSINTVARAHDHILWSRLPRLTQGRGMTCVSRDRAAFEGWTHDAALIPCDFFKVWRHKFAADKIALAQQWDGWGRRGFQSEFDRILRRISDDGPLCASDLSDGPAQKSGGWWDWKPVKTALEYLWRTGELGICHRAGFTKQYDLMERVIPPEHLNARIEEKDALHWTATAALQRLGFATPSELSAFWDIFPKKTLHDRAGALPDGVVWADIEMTDGTLRPSLVHASWEDQLASLPGPSSRLRILSPFDPALRDRARAERLFGFEYRIEIFVPEAKRTYGYYVFPILEGLQITGRIDLKADREAGALNILGYWPEKGVRFGQGRATQLADELTRLARFAGAPRISVADRPQTDILRSSRAFMALV